MEAQARLIAAYGERKWPRRPPSIADLIRHLMEQHGLTRADMVPILGDARPSELSAHFAPLMDSIISRVHGGGLRLSGACAARKYPAAPSCNSE